MNKNAKLHCTLFHCKNSRIKVSEKYNLLYKINKCKKVKRIYAQKLSKMRGDDRCRTLNRSLCSTNSKYTRQHGKIKMAAVAISNLEINST